MKRQLLFIILLLLFGLIWLAGPAFAQTIKVGSFIKPAASGTQVVPHGLGETPKALILWTNGNTNEAFGADFNLGFGVTDQSLNRYAASMASDDNVAASRARRSMSLNAIDMVDVGGTNFAQASVTSWDSTNFTLQWVIGNAATSVIHFIAISGSGVSSKVVNWQMPNATGNQSVTGVGFKPDLVIHVHAGYDFTTAPPLRTTNANLGLGVMDAAGNQWATSALSVHNVVADTQRGQQTDACIYAFDNALTVQKEASFVSMDSDGFTVNFTNTTSAAASQVFSLALKGIKAKAGSFSKTTAAQPANQSVTNVGFTPGLVLLASFQDITRTSPVVNTRLGLGASDGSTEGSSALTDTDTLNPTQVDGIDKTSKVFIKVDNNTPSINAEADLATIDSDGFTLNWTTNDAVATEMLYLALEYVQVPFEYRRLITINVSQRGSSCSGSLSNFPVLISLSDNSLKTKANGGNIYNSDGADIIFKAPGRAIRLDHEIEYYNGSTGELVAWVRIPTLFNNNQDTIIYMDYGSASITSPTENPNGVWDSNYVGVWHLDESGTGAAGEYKDATGYTNHGTAPVDGIPLRESAKIGRGQHFEDADLGDVIVINQDSELNITGVVTVEAWVELHRDYPIDYQLDMPAGIVGKGQQYQLYHNQDGARYVTFTADTTSGGAYPTDTLPQLNTWYYMVGTYDASAARIYRNGVLQSTDPQTGALYSDPVEVTFGWWGSAFDGRIDEVRISKVARDACWIETNYNTQSGPGSFTTIGNEIVLGEFENRRQITMNVSQRGPSCSGSLSDFPVLIDLSGDWLKTKANGGNIYSSEGYDIIFRASDGKTQLDHEIEHYKGSGGGGAAGISFVRSGGVSGAPGIAVDAVSTGDTRPATMTISHTTSGSNRLMLVGIGFVNDETETVTSVTYNGDALTLVGSVNSVDDARVEIWRRIAPDVGTFNVVVTFSAPLRRSAIVGVMTFTGVHQTTPLGTFASAFGQAPAAEPTVNVTSATDQLVFDTVACESCTSFTVGASQTQRWNTQELSGTPASLGAGSTENGAATTTMSWTRGSDDHWALGAVPIRPSTTGTRPVVNATSTASTPRTSITIPHTTSGTDRLMLVGVTINNQQSQTVSSITYNGVGLTLVGTDASTTNTRVEIWRLINPPTGTYNVVITFSAGVRNGAKAAVATFTGVHQTTPLGTFASANGNTVGPATVNVTSAPGELVFDTVGCEGNDTGTLCGSLTAGAGQTQRWNLTALEPGTAGAQTKAAGSTEPGAASVTMSWDIAPAAAVPWAIGAVPIKPAASSPSFSLDIGSAGTDRLVIVTADDESAGTSLSGVTVDGKACHHIVTAENTSNGNNHQEMWYCDEDDLGSSNGTVTVAISGGGGTWGVHAHLYTGVSQSGPTDFGIDNSSISTTTVTVNGIDVPANGLVVMGAGEGQNALTVNSWTSPLVQRQSEPGHPNSADLISASGIETSQQTNKTYVATFSGTFNVGTGIVASFAAASGASETGKLIAWVRIPTLFENNQDTIIYMYYGNPNITSPTANPTGVWDSNYLAVYHLNQSPAGTVYDSTGNNVDLTSGGGMGGGNLVTGQIGYGVGFDGINDRLVSAGNTITATNFTLEAWISSNDWANWHTIVEIDDNVAPTAFRNLAINGDTGGRICVDSGTPYNITAVQSGSTWRHIVARYDTGATPPLQGFLNGSSTGSGTGMSWGSIIGRTVVGAWWDAGGSEFYDFWNGVLDEVRISNSSRSNCWIETQYNNQNSPSSFSSTGSGEDLAYKYRKQLTILDGMTPASCSGDLSNFPVLISLSGNWLKTETNGGDISHPNGYDIIFKASDDVTQLDHEIEKYDGSAAGGTLIAWVRIPTLLYNADTIIYMYYGNGTVTSPTANPAGVWNSNYKGVWHLAETAGTINYDSTSNVNNGTKVSATEPNPTAAKIGDGQNFDVVDDKVTITNLTTEPTQATYSAWIKPNSGGELPGCSAIGCGRIFDKRTAGTEVLNWYVEGDTNYRMTINRQFSGGQGSWNTPSTSIMPGNQYYVVVTYDSSSAANDPLMYINGQSVTVIENTTPSGSANSNTDPYVIGNRGNQDRTFDGWIDEFRISNTLRSACWIGTEYNNQDSPLAYISVEGEEDLNYKHQKQITLLDSMTPASCSSNLTNFPVQINLTGDWLKTEANGGDISNPNGYDIIFKTQDGVTKLDHEIEEYNASTGKLIAWVRIPTLLYNANTIIYMYYGNSAITSSQANPAGVWNTGYGWRGVWHLKEDPSGAAPQIKDSTSNANHGTSAGSWTGDQVAGKIDGSLDFDAGDYISMGDRESLDMGTSDFSIEAWVRLDPSATQEGETIVWKGAGSTSNAGYWLFWYNMFDYIRFTISNGDGVTSRPLVNSTNISSIMEDGLWHHVVAVADRGGNGSLYIDGQLNNSSDWSSYTGSINTTTGFAFNVSTPEWTLAGGLDEVRIAAVARDACWIGTSYNNQYSPLATYSVEGDESAYKYRKQITILDSMTPASCSSNLSNFPVLISLSGDWLKTEANGGNISNPNGYDIIFKSQDGVTKLEHEIEQYDTGGAPGISFVRSGGTSGGAGAITFDAASEGNTGDNQVGSLTVPHTVGSGSNRILVVGVNIYYGSGDPLARVATMTYAGQNMTFLATAVDNAAPADKRIRSEMWYITAPATGTNNIYMTFDINCRAVAGGMSYTGVHQTTPFGTPATAGGNSATPSVVVSSATGELVVDTVGIRNDDGNPVTLTAGANQTERYNDRTGIDATNSVGAGSQEAGATSVTMSWTSPVGRLWAIVAAPLKPAASSSSPSFSFDIGSAGTNRLVVITAGDESTGTNLSGVTVDGKACNLIVRADNPNGSGNHQEMWYCDEDNLGSSSGTVTVATSGGDGSWAVHAHLYTGVAQSGPTDYGINQTSVNSTTVAVTGIDVLAKGLVVMGTGEGTDGLSVNTWTSPLAQRQSEPGHPASADLMSASGIETSAQTNKTYTATFSGTFDRGTGIVASFAEASSAGSGTGKLVAWVRIPTLLYNGSTVIYMYYGNPTITSPTSNPVAVWNEGGNNYYKGVWHLQQTSGTYLDSTGNNNAGTAAVTSRTATAKIGTNAPQFDSATNNNINCGTGSSLDFSGNMTLEAWIYPTGWGEAGFGAIVERGAEPSDGYEFYVRQASTSLAIYDGGSLAGNVGSISLGTWQHVVVVVSGGSTASFYVNGVGAGSGSWDFVAGGSASFYMGSFSDMADTFAGTIDEVRASNVARSACWIGTSYNNQDSPATHIAVEGDESAFKYRKQIAILDGMTPASCSSNLSNYPVLISLSNQTWLKTEANGGDITSPNGYDIVFKAQDGATKLDHEIEKYDGSATGGTLVAWVRIPTLVYNGSTSIYMYYGNPTITSPTENPAGVWDSNYKGVWHLKEDPSGTAPQMKDSTSNANHGASYGSMTSGDQVGAKINGGLDLESDDYINATNNGSTLNVGQTFTVEAWVKRDTIGAKTVATKTYSDQYTFKLSFTGSDVLRLDVNTGAGYVNVQGDTITDTNWHYVGGYSNGTNIRVFRDGVIHANSNSTPAAIPYDSSNLWIGVGRWASGPVDFFDGIIDEVRISNVARSDCWIGTNYNNQTDPSTYISVEGEEILDFKYQKQITISDSMTPASCSGDLSNFPVLISLSGDWLKTEANGGDISNPNGYDIIFKDENGVAKLDHEIEQYDGSATGGTLLAWVRIPTLLYNANTIIYVYYGNSAITSPTANPAGVWSNNYRGVWHLKEGGDGSLDEYKDSSQYANHGQGGEGNPLFVPTRVAGKVSYGQDFNNSDGKYDLIDCGNDSSLDITGDQITLEAWVRHDTSVEREYGILNHKGWNSGYSLWMQGDHFQCPSGDTQCVQFNLPGSTHSLRTQTTLTGSAWHHVVGTYDGASMKVFIDGVQDSNTLSKTGNITAPSPPENEVWIGHGDQPKDVGWSAEWLGQIDEVRISSTARSACWIGTQYNNQNSPGMYISVEGEDYSGYQYREQITITAPAGKAVPSDYPIKLTFDHASLVAAGDSQADGDDIRVIYWNGTNWVELARILFNDKINSSSWNLNNTQILFKTQAQIPAGTSSTSYYLLYGNPSAANPPTNTPSSRYYRAQSLGVTARTSTGYANKVQLQFTPSSSSEHWAVMATWRMRRDPAQPDAWYTGRGRVTLNGTPRTGNDNITFRMAQGVWKTFNVFFKITGTTSQQTVGIDFASYSGDADEIDNARIIAFLIPNPSNADIRYSETLAMATDIGATNAQALTFTPSSAGDYIWMANSFHHEGPGGSGNGIFARDDTATDQQCSWDSYIPETEGFIPMVHFERRNLTATSKTFTIRHVADTGSGSERQGLTQLLFRSDVFDAVEVADAAGETSTTQTTYQPKNSLTTASVAIPYDYVYLAVMGMTNGVQNVDLSTFGEIRLNAVQQLEEEVAIDRDISYYRQIAWAYAETTTGNRTIDSRYRAESTQTTYARYAHILSLRYIEPNTTVGTQEQATAVKLASFTAKQYGNGVLLSWKTGHEVDNLGFHIYREENGQLVRLTPEPVAGSALLAGSSIALKAGHHYTWWDFSSLGTRFPSLGLRYWLEDIDLNGKRTMHGPVMPVLSQEPLPEKMNSELLSELGMRLEQRYQNYWRARELKEKLRQKSPVIGHQVSALKNKGELRSKVAIALKARRASSLSSRREGDRLMQQYLASRPAVKILVNEEGWYRVSQPELVAAGLNSNANPQYLQLFVDGRELPIRIIGDKDGRFDPGDAVEFYGIGLDTPSTDTRVYWLVEGLRPGRRMNESGGLGGSASPASFPYTVEKKDRLIYFPAVRNGDLENFFGPLVYTGQVDQLLEIWNLDQAAIEDAYLEVVLQGGTEGTHRVKVYLNHVEVGELVFVGQAKGTLSTEVPQSLLLEGENLLTLEVQAQGGELDVSVIDTIRLTYWHTYTAENDFLKFTAPGGSYLYVDSFSQSRIRVVDITALGSPIEVVGKVEAQETSYVIGFRVPGSGLRTLMAFTEGRIKNPLGAFSNLPSSWHKASNEGDMVMLAHGDFLLSLKFLKALRQSQGLSVDLIDIEDIYDEFSFGHKSPKAIRDFLANAKSKWKKSPRYVLLVGDASLDPRNYLGYGDFDFVPTKLIDTLYTETASDDWFVDFNDDGLPEMAIGRLPVRTPEETSIIASKIVGHERSGTQKVALLVADIQKPDDNFDFEGASEEVKDLLPSSMMARKIYRSQFSSDAQAKGALLAGINEGSLLVNFIGHGSEDTWRGIFTSEDVENLTNRGLPFFINMTCLNGAFQYPNIESLAEALIKASGGGAIAVWTSSGLTVPSGQSLMNKELIKLLFNGEPMTLGEAISRAKAATFDQDVRRTWILFGDPAATLQNQGHRRIGPRP